MDPGALQLQEVISLAGGAGAKFQVSLANGNVVVVPLPQSSPPPPLPLQPSEHTTVICPPLLSSSPSGPVQVELVPMQTQVSVVLFLYAS